MEENFVEDGPVAYYVYVRGGIGGIMPVGPRRQRLFKNEMMFRRCNPVEDSGGTGLLHFDPRVSKMEENFVEDDP